MQSGKTVWTQDRLERLFHRYDRLYFGGRLSNFSVLICDLREKNAVGRCERSKHKIYIDVDEHRKDREIRSTLLHEMCHAASTHGHGHEFFAQIENLLSRKAPITISSPEAGAVAKVYENIVPPRFPLARRAMLKAEAKRIRELNKKFPPGAVPIEDVGDLTRQFEEDAAELEKWKYALVGVAGPFGLVDDSGRPLTKWAKQMFPKWKRAYRRGRTRALDAHKLARLFDLKKELRAVVERLAKAQGRAGTVMLPPNVADKVDQSSNEPGFERWKTVSKAVKWHERLIEQIKACLRKEKP